MFIEINNIDSKNLPIVPMYIAHTDNQENISRPNGSVRSFFLWILDGKGSFTVDNETRILSQNQGILIKSGTPHQYHRVSKNFSTMWVSFLGGDAILDYYGIDNYFFFDVPYFLTDSTKHLMEIAKNTSSVSMRSAYAFSWITEFFESQRKENTYLCNEIIQFLEKNFNKPITLDNVSKHIKKDKFALCHEYKKKTGETIMQTLKKIRIQKAKTLLLCSSYSIKEIATLCSFESPSYFIKTFKESTGISPGTFRIQEKQF